MSEPNALFVQLAHALGAGIIRIIMDSQDPHHPACHIDAVAREQLSLGDGVFSAEHILKILKVETPLPTLLERSGEIFLSALPVGTATLDVTISSVKESHLLIAVRYHDMPMHADTPLVASSEDEWGLLTIFLSADHTILASYVQEPAELSPYFGTLSQLQGKHICHVLDEKLCARLVIALGQAQSTQSRQTAYFPSPLEGDHRYLKANGRWLGSHGLDLYAIEIENVSFDLTLNKVRPMDQGFLIIEGGAVLFTDPVATMLVGSRTDLFDELAQRPPKVHGTLSVNGGEEGQHHLIHSAALALGASEMSVIMIRSDIPLQERSTMSAEDQQFVTLLLDLSFQLLRTPRERADIIVNHILERLGVFTGSDRTYIFQFEDDLRRMSNTHEWVSDRISREKDNLQDMPSDIFPQWMNSLTHGQEIYIHDVDNLPPSWQVEKETLQFQDIKTVLVEPIITDTRLHGFIGFDRVREGRDWGYNERSLLSHFSHLLAAYFERTTQERELASALAISRTLAEEREQINVDLNIFYAKISHDIRTILNAIIGTSKLLSDTGLDPLQRRYMQIIESNNTLLSNLLRDILDFSLFGKRQLVIQELVFSLRETISTIVHTLQLAADERGMRIDVDIDRTIPCRLIGDSTRITQILLNVVHNAIKYAGSGDVRISLSLVDLDIGKATVACTVSDQGVGMEEALIKALLSSSPTLEKTARSHNSGYGLGLIIVRQLITALGGSLAIDSKRGSGTAITVTFTFKRPLDTGFTPPRENACKRQVIIAQAAQSGLYGYLSQHHEAVYHAPDLEDLLTLLSTTASPRPEFIRVIFIDEDLIDSRSEAYAQLGDLLVQADQEVPVFLLVDRYDPARHHSPAPLLPYAGFIFKGEDFASQLNEVGCKMAILPALDAETTKEHYDFSGFKVLIVDDIPFNLELMEHRLKALRIDVATANSGEHAYLKVKEQPFDLIFMDLMMPQMDGIETTRKIRALPAIEKKMIPVVAVSASVSNEDEKRCHLVGIQDFLVKPVGQQELIGILAKYAHVTPTRIKVQAGSETKGTTTIGGMDYQKALSITNGDEHLLRQLLRRFIIDWGDHRHGYTVASKSKEDEIRYLHSLLGVLSILHHPQLHLLCEQLLVAVRQSDDEKRAQIAPQFFALFDTFVTSVRAALEESDSISAPVPLFADAAPINEILTDLVEPLSRRNLSSVRRLSALLQTIKAEETVQKDIKGLLALIHAYDYAGALDLLETLGYHTGATHA